MYIADEAVQQALHIYIAQIVSLVIVPDRFGAAEVRCNGWLELLTHASQVPWGYSSSATHVILRPCLHHSQACGSRYARRPARATFTIFAWTCLTELVMCNTFLNPSTPAHRTCRHRGQAKPVRTATGGRTAPEQNPRVAALVARFNLASMTKAWGAILGHHGGSQAYYVVLRSKRPIRRRRQSDDIFIRKVA